MPTGTPRGQTREKGLLTCEAPPGKILSLAGACSTISKEMLLKSEPRDRSEVEGTEIGSYTHEASTVVVATLQPTHHEGEGPDPGPRPLMIEEPVAFPLGSKCLAPLADTTCPTGCDTAIQIRKSNRALLGTGST